MIYLAKFSLVSGPVSQKCLFANEWMQSGCG